VVGRWGIVGSIILLSFYSVVGGWIIIYLFKTIFGELGSLKSSEFGKVFANTSANPLLALGAQIIFLLVTILVVARGIRHGIEKASKVLMPTLFFLLIIVMINSLLLDGAMKGVSYFLSFNFSELTAESILIALGQSFFLLSVGFSNQITYSSYLSKKESLVQSATTVVLMNILVALLGGLSIFPAVFSYNIEPEVGPGLLFIALPAALNQMSFGSFFLILFLLVFLFAALTSTFPLLEVVVAAVTKGHLAKRKKWAWIIGIIIFIVGIPSALSFGVLEDIEIFGQTIFDSANYLVSSIMLPIGALLIALFIHFKIPREILSREFTTGLSNGKKLFVVWLFIIKYVAPIAILLAFLHVA